MKLSNGMPCVCIADAKYGAKQILNRNALNYIESGADDEKTFQDNENAFNRIALRPRVFRNVADIDTSSSILGEKISLPIGIAPMAFHRLAHNEGEKATYRAACKANIPMTLSTLATTSIEDTIESSSDPGLLFFQLYTVKDKETTRNLMRRAECVGYKAVVVTVDAPVLGTRRSDERMKFHLPPNMRAANFGEQEISAMDELEHGSALHALFLGDLDKSVTWSYIDWMRETTTLPIVVKGILTAEDAIEAWKHECAAVWVSNHGGRQVDTSISPIDALPEIVEALKLSGLEVYVDGGVRRGTDIFKALALGADCVFIGRAALYGLAVDGENGVSWVIQTLKEELEKAMCLCGASSLCSISPSMIKQVPYSFPPSTNDKRIAEYESSLETAKLSQEIEPWN